MRCDNIDCLLPLFPYMTEAFLDGLFQRDELCNRNRICNPQTRAVHASTRSHMWHEEEEACETSSYLVNKASFKLVKQQKEALKDSGSGHGPKTLPSEIL
jgi:hypothetical protein